MKIISKPKRGGKTFELIKMAAEKGGYIVCHSTQEARRIKELAISLGLKIAMPITYDDFENRSYYASGMQELYIDNAEMFLQNLTPVKIAAITITQSIEPK